VSGVWLAVNSHFGGTVSAACFALKTFGIDDMTQPFPSLTIFSGGKRFEIREEREVEAKAKAVTAKKEGNFQIAEMQSIPRTQLPWSGQNILKLRIIEPGTIDIVEGDKLTRFPWVEITIGELLRTSC
jgi:hypothetical protein